MPVEPDEQQLLEIAGLARDAKHPVVMLNLNRYREQARYDGDPPDGLSGDVTGREAYERYAEVALAVLTRLEGKVLWVAPATRTVVGDETDRYDEVLAVWYPSVAAFVALATDAETLAARPHRLAALERAALLCCASGPEPVLAGV